MPAAIFEAKPNLVVEAGVVGPDSSNWVPFTVMLVTLVGVTVGKTVVA